MIHRDIKPSNIMLGAYGETLVVDWGLAKVAGSAATLEAEEGLRPVSPPGPDGTIAGFAIGTPGYMSPEQASGSLEQVGPRSDVYSLGATLLNLLTGAAPTGDASALATEAASPPDGTSIAAPAAAAVPRGLEAVCLKAMATQPDDRYATARALADDVEAWLAGEPVSAWRDPRTVRLRRWVRRHRPLVAAGVGAAAMAIVALGATAVALTEKNRELSRQRDVAEQRLDVAIRAVGQFREAVANNDELRSRPDLAPLRKQLLKTPLAFYRQLRSDVEQSGAAGAAPVRLAQALAGLALITSEIDSEPQAISALRDAIGVLEPLAGAQPSGHRDDLARSHFRLGALLAATGHVDEAVATTERSRALWEALARASPADNLCQAEMATADDALAVLYRQTGRRDQARTRHEQALAIRETLTRDHPEDSSYRADLALSRFNLGLLEIDAGQVRVALAHLESARDLQEALVKERPDVTVYRFSLAYTYAPGRLAFRTRPTRQVSGMLRAVARFLGDARPRTSREHELPRGPRVERSGLGPGAIR